MHLLLLPLMALASCGKATACRWRTCQGGFYTPTLALSTHCVPTGGAPPSEAAAAPQGGQVGGTISGSEDKLGPDAVITGHTAFKGVLQVCGAMGIAA
jgi:hypothetical protein